MARCPTCTTDLPAESRFCLACGTALDSSYPPTLVQADGQAPAARRASNATPPSPRHVAADEPPDQTNFVPGAVLAGRYRIVGLLGRGGMGEVYRADDLKLGQPVALKLLPERLAGDGAALARFHREVRVARQVSHPNVCRVFDIGEADGLHFLSMEYIDGEDLASLLRRIGRLPGDKALEIARQLCAGLGAAHDSGVMHRDLKPANVMIDGRGRARIMDFGLAVLGDHFQGELFAGTPAYMSPEQLAGREITPQSDIYALGLVLYEIFTGKRAFGDSDFAEMMRRREQDKPLTPSSHLKEIDPLTERVIMRCLEKDPRSRPASALAVAATLPGGDPLQAALAAGETPSPEMVVAAPATGALRPVVAVTCLAAFFVGLVAVVLLTDKVALYRQVPLDKSPDVLTDRAATMIKRFGYTEPAAERVYGFSRNSNYIHYLMEHDASPRRFEKLAAGRPWAMTFEYRQSPRRLQPSDYWDVTFNDPPLAESGMINVRLDTEGRLIDFYAFPPVFEPSTTAAAFDWSPLFAAAELDLSSFKPAPSEWVPPVAYDNRAAWEGVFPEQPDIPLRVEAASFAGKPVYFEMIGPWTRPARLGQADPSARDKGQQGLVLVIIIACIIGGGVLARHNLRLGRSDRRGAFRMALFILIVWVLGWIFGANHVPMSSPINGVMPLAWATPIVWALYTAGFLWVFYIALEPDLRQRWPHRIISWSRLLAGRLRDPLVGRDLLIGGLFALAYVLVGYAGLLVPRWLGLPPPAPKSIDFRLLLGGRGLLGMLFSAQVQSLISGFGTMILVLLLYLGLRREWLAVAVVWLLVTSLRLLGDGSISTVHFIAAGIEFALSFVVLMRYGLLAAIAAQFFNWCWSYPLTADFSAWYAGSGEFGMIIAVGLALYGFYTSLARNQGSRFRIQLSPGS
jgi:Protein kinase domain